MYGLIWFVQCIIMRALNLTYCATLLTLRAHTCRSYHQRRASKFKIIIIYDVILGDNTVHERIKNCRDVFGTLFLFLRPTNSAWTRQYLIRCAAMGVSGLFLIWYFHRAVKIIATLDSRVFILIHPCLPILLKKIPKVEKIIKCDWTVQCFVYHRRLLKKKKKNNK